MIYKTDHNIKDWHVLDNASASSRTAFFSRANGSVALIYSECSFKMNFNHILGKNQVFNKINILLKEKDFTETVLISKVCFNFNGNCWASLKIFLKQRMLCLHLSVA